MATILDKIIATKHKELEQRKQQISIADLEKQIKSFSITNSLSLSIKNSSTGIISEFKRKSPSLGWIAENADAQSVCEGYSLAGASGISILTDEDYFGGKLSDIEQARPYISCPVLRKEFIIDEYQLYEAKAIGADAILLIAAALSKKETLALSQKAKELGLEILLEIHNEEELAHANPYVNLLGVNNRNLKTFEQSIQTSIDLVDIIPSDFVKISESGISKTSTVKDLKQIGYQGFLMGENFMKTSDPALALSNFIKELSC